MAIVLSLLDQPTILPDNGVPLASAGVAVNTTVWPTTIVAVGGVTVTVATGTTRTATVADPCFPSTVAMITAFPAARPVTMPDDETVASAGVPLDQKMVRPVRGCPETFLGVAISWTVLPATMLDDAGVTSTATTGSGAIVTTAVPNAPSLVAVIVAEPAATPVTRPEDDTVATALLLVENETVCPVST